MAGEWLELPGNRRGGVPRAAFDANVGREITRDAARGGVFLKPYEYHAPTTMSGAVALLAEKGERARPLAGGTDLLVQMRAGRFELERVVDINPVPRVGYACL